MIADEGQNCAQSCEANSMKAYGDAHWIASNAIFENQFIMNDVGINLGHTGCSGASETKNFVVPIYHITL